MFFRGYLGNKIDFVNFWSESAILSYGTAEENPTCTFLFDFSRSYKALMIMIWKKLYVGTVPASYLLYVGTVPNEQLDKEGYSLIRLTFYSHVSLLYVFL